MNCLVLLFLNWYICICVYCFYLFIEWNFDRGIVLVKLILYVYVNKIVFFSNDKENNMK